MKTLFLAILSMAVIGFNGTAWSQEVDGAALFSQHCESCHGQGQHPRVAPPLMGIRKHLQQAFPDQEDFVAQVENWLRDPDPEKAIMKHAVERFGAMPPLALADEEIQAIANYLFADKPGGDHGKGHEKGKGKNKACQDCGKHQGGRQQEH